MLILLVLLLTADPPKGQAGGGVQSRLGGWAAVVGHRLGVRRDAMRPPMGLPGSIVVRGRGVRVMPRARRRAGLPDDGAMNHMVAKNLLASKACWRLSM